MWQLCFLIKKKSTWQYLQAAGVEIDPSGFHVDTVSWQHVFFWYEELFFSHTKTTWIWKNQEDVPLEIFPFLVQL